MVVVECKPILDVVLQLLDILNKHDAATALRNEMSKPDSTSMTFSRNLEDEIKASTRNLTQCLLQLKGAVTYPQRQSSRKTTVHLKGNDEAPEEPPLPHEITESTEAEEKIEDELPFLNLFEAPSGEGHSIEELVQANEDQFFGPLDTEVLQTYQTQAKTFGGSIWIGNRSVTMDTKMTSKMIEAELEYMKTLRSMTTPGMQSLRRGVLRLEQLHALMKQFESGVRLPPGPAAPKNTGTAGTAGSGSAPKCGCALQ